MGDQHHGLAQVAGRVVEQIKDRGAGVGVEGAGGFVGEDDGGSGDQRPGDRDPLPLSPRELGGATVPPSSPGTAMFQKPESR